MTKKITEMTWQEIYDHHTHKDDGRCLGYFEGGQYLKEILQEEESRIEY